MRIDFGEGDDELNANQEDNSREGSLEAAAHRPEGDNFIDDSELPPDQRIDFGDDEEEDDNPDALAFDEAEEVGEGEEYELDNLFDRGRHKELEKSDAENRQIVENFLAQMEVAVEEDEKELEAKRPAIHKLRMLKRVREVLTTKRLHNELLESGLLNVLEAWIRPMKDGSLPNSKVRGTVLDLLTLLPIDCAYEDRREQLKRSGLGRIVMFLYKLPDETPANRKLAKQLVEKWSRPILSSRMHSIDEEESKRILEARQARAAKASSHGGPSANVTEDAPDEATAKPGQPGYRWHAAIPQAASLDYVKKPSSKVSGLPEKKAGGKGPEHKLTKKLRTMKKAPGGQAATVSIEGRNVTIQH